MESLIDLHIEKLPEGFYLATSPNMQGLVAQGRTVSETLEIARDVARKLIEAKKDREGGEITLPAVKERFDYSLVVGY